MFRQRHLVVESRLEVLSKVQIWFKESYWHLQTEAAWLAPYYDRLNLALAEGFTNAVRHAHAHLPAETTIEIGLALRRDHIEIRVWDWGHPFNPDTLTEPEPGALLEGGYGWFLLRRLADSVMYKPADDGRNCLRIIQYGAISDEGSLE